MTEPWERLPDESTKAYAAFFEYLKTSREERSLIGTYRQVSGKSQARSYPGFFRDWIERFRWTERAYAYDDAQLEKDLKALELQRKEARVRQAKLGKELQEKGKSLLNRTDELDAASGTSMIIMGQKVENIALGVSTEICECNIKGEVSMHVERFFADPEATRLACELTERLGARKADPGIVRDVREPGPVDPGEASRAPQP